MGTDVIPTALARLVSTLGILQFLRVMWRKIASTPTNQSATKLIHSMPENATSAEECGFCFE